LVRTIDTITKPVRSSARGRQLVRYATPHGKVILTLLAGLAEFERSLIMLRTQADILRAHELGVAFGRKPKLNPGQPSATRKANDGGAGM
jgi:DNA invertase Pin-like site-specific DNA recombinase